MTDPTNDSASRWAAASKLADGVLDDGFQKRRNRILIRLAVLVAAAWLAGIVIALLFLPKTGSGHSAGGGTSIQQLTGQIVFLVLGFGVGIVGFIWARRTGHYVTRWSAVASPLNLAEKKSVRRQISGKESIDTEHLPVIVAIATQNRRATIGIAPIYAAIVLFATATAIGTNVVSLKITELAASLLIVVAATQLFVLYRTTGRFVASQAGRSS